MLLADLNAHTIRWSDRDENAAGLELEDAIAAAGWDDGLGDDVGCVASIRPRPGENASRPDVTSDHLPLVAEIDLYGVADAPTLRTTGRTQYKFPPRDHRVWSLYRERAEDAIASSREEFTHLLAMARNQTVRAKNGSQKCLTHAYGLLVDAMKEAARVIPRRSETDLQLPGFWTRKCEEAKEACVASLAHAMRPGATDADIAEHDEHRREFREVVSEERNEFIKKRIEALDPSRPVDWKFLRGSAQSPVAPVVHDINGTELRTRRAQANAFARFYAPPPTKTHRRPKLPQWRRHTPPPTAAELSAALRKLNNRRAAGPDGIHAEMLKYVDGTCRRLLEDLISASITIGEMPQQWKESITIPIHKPGKERKLLQSYRPIGLCSITAKWCESIMTKRLQYRLQLSGRQFGFRAQRRTDDVVMLLVDETARAKSETYYSPVWNVARGRFEDYWRAGRAVTLHYDLTKAYDYVSHNSIIRKMRDRGVDGYIVRWFASFLRGRYTVFDVNGTRSDRRPVRRGVIQGAVSSPLLFLLVIDGLLERLQQAGISAYAFADDVKTCTTGRDAASAVAAAQVGADIVREWAAEEDQEIGEDGCAAGDAE